MMQHPVDVVALILITTALLSASLLHDGPGGVVDAFTSIHHEPAVRLRWRRGGVGG